MRLSLVQLKSLRRGLRRSANRQEFQCRGQKFSGFLFMRIFPPIEPNAKRTIRFHRCDGHFRTTGIQHDDITHFKIHDHSDTRDHLSIPPGLTTEDPCLRKSPHLKKSRHRDNKQKRRHPRAPPFLKSSAQSLFHVEPVKIHHLVPSLDEVTRETRFRVALRIDFSNRTEDGVRSEHQVRARA